MWAVRVTREKRIGQADGFRTVTRRRQGFDVKCLCFLTKRAVRESTAVLLQGAERRLRRTQAERSSRLIHQRDLLAEIR